jgi:hypothetical protein
MNAFASVSHPPLLCCPLSAMRCSAPSSVPRRSAGLDVPAATLTVICVEPKSESVAGRRLNIFPPRRSEVGRA